MEINKKSVITYVAANDLKGENVIEIHKGSSIEHRTYFETFLNLLPNELKMPMMNWADIARILLYNGDMLIVVDDISISKEENIAYDVFVPNEPTDLQLNILNYNRQLFEEHETICFEYDYSKEDAFPSNLDNYFEKHQTQQYTKVG